MGPPSARRNPSPTLTRDLHYICTSIIRRKRITCTQIYVAPSAQRPACDLSRVASNDEPINASISIRRHMTPLAELPDDRAAW